MRKIAAWVTFVAWCLFITAGAVEAQGLRVIFLDVGDGDSALLECNGEYMLIDTGRVGAWEHLQDTLVQADVKELKYLVLSHPHSDHIGGAAKIVDEYGVEAAILPPIEHDTAAFDNMIDSLARHGTDLIYPNVGDIFMLGDAEITVYGPHSVAYANMNDWSVVLMVRYGGRSILFTGDIEAEAEADLVAINDQFPLKADVLKVAHHGSDSSTTRAFVEAVTPLYAIVSCRSDKRKNYPSTDVAMTLVDCGVLNIFSTEVYGDIGIHMDGTGALIISSMENKALDGAA